MNPLSHDIRDRHFYRYYKDYCFMPEKFPRGNLNSRVMFPGFKSLFMIYHNSGIGQPAEVLALFMEVNNEFKTL